VKQFTLGKKERLKSRKQIEQLFKEGKTFSVQPLRIYYTVQPSTADSSLLQFGVAVGTKQFKHAVDRNRIKRLIREAYRLQKNELHEQVVSKKKAINLFFIYTGKELPQYQLIYETVRIALQKLQQIIVQSAT
jgi:ribonuclease P protein component